MAPDQDNLSTTSDPKLLGRQRELEQLRAWLASDPGTPIAIVGAPGVGKSALARALHPAVRLDLRCKPEDVALAAWLEEQIADSTLDGLVCLDNLEPPHLPALFALIDHRRNIERAGQPPVCTPPEEPHRDEKQPATAWRCGWLLTSVLPPRLEPLRCLRLEPLGLDDARALFLRRARARWPEFAAKGEPLEALDSLLERLDGLPLAIVQAADRVCLLPPREMLPRLDRRFSLLRAREPDEVDLIESLERGWRSLSEQAREVLSQLCAFCGCFRLEAAERLLQTRENPERLDKLEELILASFVERKMGREGLQLRLLETFRLFVRRELPPDEHVAARHAAWAIERGEELLEEVYRGARGHQELLAHRAELEEAFRRQLTQRALTDASRCARLLARVDALQGEQKATRDRFSRLLSYCEQPEDVLLRAYVLEQLGRHSVREGQLNEALELLEGAQRLASELLEQGQSNEPTSGKRERVEGLQREQVAAPWLRPAVTLGWSLYRGAEIKRNMGRCTEALEEFERSLELATAQGLDSLERVVLVHLACCHVDLEEEEEARGCLDALQPQTQAEDPYDECDVLRRIAYVYYFLRDPRAQRRANRKALEIAERIGDLRLQGWCLQGLGDSAYANGALEEAREYYDEALSVLRRGGDVHREGMLLGNLGAVLHRLEELDEARQRYEASLDRHSETGALLYESVVLHALGVLYHELGQLEEARRLLEAAVDNYRELGQSSDEAGMLLCLGWLELELHDPREAAAEHFREALDLFVSSGQSRWAALARGSLTLAQLSEGTSTSAAPQALPGFEQLDGQGQRSGLLELLAICTRSGPPDDHYWRLRQKLFGDKQLRMSLYGRVLLRLYRERYEPQEEPPEDLAPLDDQRQRLTIASGYTWFHLSGEGRVSLKRRKALRSVLEALTCLYLEEPGEGLNALELFEAGWPEQQISPKSAAERVYWAVGKLRQLGLEGVLLTTETGYLLDPEIDIELLHEESE